MMAGLSATANAKGHMQPADKAEFGQQNAKMSGARNADARGLDGSDKGVDGRMHSDMRSDQKGSDSGMKSMDHMKSMHKSTTARK
jgi:hypothetical protein